MKKATPIIAILVIGSLMFYAITKGLDGVLLAGGIAIIAGLAGYVAPHRKQ